MAHSPLMHRERLQRLLDRVETKLKKDPWLAEVKAGRRAPIGVLNRIDRAMRIKILRGGCDPWTATLYHSIVRTALTNAAQVDDRKITGEKCFTSNLSVVTSGGLSR